MSIATEISRLQTAKASIKTAIEDKGVVVPSSATLETYADYIGSIEYDYVEPVTLPEGFTQVKYIQTSDNTCAFITDYLGDGTEWFEYDYTPLTWGASLNPHIFSAPNFYAPRLRPIATTGTTSNSIQSYRCGSQVNATFQEDAIGKKYHIVAYKDNDNVVVNGEIIGSTSAGSSNPTQCCAFGGYTSNGVDIGAQYVSMARYYRFTIGVNSTILLDYVPAKRNSDSVYGMYDLVSQDFYISKGTPYFGGPVV